MAENEDKNNENQNFSPDQLKEAEENAGSEETSLSPAELANEEYGKIGAGFNPDDKNVRFRRLKTTGNLLKRRKWLFIGGGGIVSIIFLLLSLLSPFKIFHIIQGIEKRVGNIPEYAMERRMQYYMNRYLIIRALQESGDMPDGYDGVKSRYVYLDRGAFKTLYTNWKGAKLEKVMRDNYGVSINPKIRKDEILGKQYLRPTDWEVKFKGTSRALNLGDSKEARNFIRDFVNTETRSYQIFKRYHHRRILKNYYGVTDWKIFETQRDSARRSYLERKLALKKYLIQQTLGRMSSSYSAYMICLLEGGDKCKEVRRSRADPSTSNTVKNEAGEELNGGAESKAAAENGIGAVGNEAAEEIIEELTENEGADAAQKLSQKTLSKKLSEQIQKVGMKKILASFAAGIGIVDTIAQVVKAIDTGALNIVVYAKNAQQYASFTAPMLSMADQIRAGEDIDATDARIANEIFDGFDKSPVYQAGLNSTSTALAAATQIRRDCNDDGDETDKEDLLEPGETVCPHKRLVQDKTTFTQSDGWQVLSKIASAYRSTVGVIVGAFTKIVDTVLDVTGLDSVIQSVLDATGISDLAAGAFKWIMNRVAGPVITGAEVGEDAYDAVYAGVAVQKSSLGGGVGENREDTIGGAYLNDKQVFALKREDAEFKSYARGRQSIFERYFSPENSDSVTASLIMRSPSDSASTVNKFASLISGAFGTLANTFGRLFAPRTDAQNSSNPNPFHVIYYGYPIEDEVLEMEPDELWAKYNCDLPPAERPQNKNESYGRPDGIPFDVALKTDPCQLEQAVEKGGSAYFDGSYDEGI